MTHPIDAILFDMGGTLRRCSLREEAGRNEHVQHILDLIGADIPAPAFQQRLTDRARAYNQWAKENLVELDEISLWTEWMLPDFPREQITPLAVELNLAWKDVRGTYHMISGAKETIQGLYRRGYRLGLVSNTTSSVDVPKMLEKEGLAGYFEVIVLSCVVGKRKPHPDILNEAASRMGFPPERCAYIGNLPERDAAAARNASFHTAVILRDPERQSQIPGAMEPEPDHTIDQLAELLDIFPHRNGRFAWGRCDKTYNMSLSSMWGMRNFAQLEDFLVVARRLGFSGVELNHQVTPAMLENLDFEQLPITSLHEPCPALVPADVLKKQDILISSPNEERRRQGVDSIRRSIDLASKVGAKSVVIHAGMVQVDPSWEKKLVSLFEAGKHSTVAYQQIKDEMIRIRKEEVNPCIQAVKKSLVELLTHAGETGIRLGLENRYHYFDLPSPDEMAEFLALADTERLGFIYDSGHAQALDRLGFYPHENWLKRFSDRMIGSHLHDAIGIQDHLAPGLGEIDFHMVASHLPPSAYRAMEVHPHNKFEQVRNGLILLRDAGCIQANQGGAHAQAV